MGAIPSAGKQVSALRRLRKGRHGLDARGAKKCRSRGLKRRLIWISSDAAVFEATEKSAAKKKASNPLI